MFLLLELAPKRKHEKRRHVEASEAKKDQIAITNDDDDINTEQPFKTPGTQDNSSTAPKTTSPISFHETLE
jgi:hypothetical protein